MIVLQSRLGCGFGSLLSSGILPKRHVNADTNKPQSTGDSPESILETPSDALEVSHPPSAGGLSAFRLLAPLIRS